MVSQVRRYSKTKTHFFDFMLSCFLRLDNDELCLFCICLWKVWSIRNGIVHELNSIREVDILEWASCYFSEFQEARPALARGAKVTGGDQVWIPPGPNIYKINCDAALSGSSSLAGVGIVIRDHCGMVMVASSQKFVATFTPQVAEAMAILQSLQLAIDSGLFPCCVESDAKVVVDWINSNKVLFSDIGSVISDIRRLCLQARCGSFLFVPRKANQIVHVLAKNSLSCDEDMFWLEEFPPCVGSLVAVECRGSL